MKNESTYRIIVVVLLAGILIVQLTSLLKTPYTKRGIPIVSVAGSVDVDVQNPSLDVNVEDPVEVNGSVEIDSQPIDVHIVPE
jgi:hypothetical protein